MCKMLVLINIPQGRYPFPANQPEFASPLKAALQVVRQAGNEYAKVNGWHEASCQTCVFLTEINQRKIDTMRFFAFAISLVLPTIAQAETCDTLADKFGLYDSAFIFFDRVSEAESSTLRASTAQAAVTNILLRQGMILDMMIAKSCELPSPPNFPILGLVSSNN